MQLKCLIMLNVIMSWLAEVKLMSSAVPDAQERGTEGAVQLTGGEASFVISTEVTERDSPALFASLREMESCCRLKSMHENCEGNRHFSGMYLEKSKMPK